MAKDAADILEATRQNLIGKLLRKREEIDAQLKALRYEPQRQPPLRET
jgi:hypothetical protein